MRTTIDKMARLAALTMALGAASPTLTLALDDAATLRCDASVAKTEARLYGCIASCGEKALKRGSSAAELDRCTGKCARTYEHGLRSPRCGASSRERKSAVALATLTAETLRCDEIAATLESKLLSCLADCAELADYAADRGAPFEVGLCADRCADLDAEAAARAEARSGCTLSE